MSQRKTTPSATSSKNDHQSITPAPLLRSGSGSSNRLKDIGQSSLGQMDSMLQRLNQNVSSLSTSSSSAAPEPQQQHNNPQPPLSATAAKLLKSIDSFDLFTTVGSRVPSASSSSVKRPVAIISSSSSSSSSAPPCGVSVGSDDPIPSHAPPMSDAVMMMMHGSGLSNAPENEEEDSNALPGSKVTFVGRQQPRPLGLMSSGGGFLASLERANQSIYFEELQYQLAQ